jgi:tRNA-dihydrouridine synthase B
MAGVTDLAYRKIARRFGCELAFTEMVKDIPVVQRNERTLEMVRSADWDHPLGMQLVGRDPKTMAEAARVLEGLGADVIDVNLGCPVRKVVSDGCGAALLKEPEQVGRVLDAMIAAVRVPVTIKIRTGFESGDDQRFLEIVRIASRCGVGAITAHGRTRQQQYSGFSNLQAIKAVKDVATVPVIGNGDIRSGADAKRMIDQTGCDGVMLARGTLGNPWIYREVSQYLSTGTLPPAPTASERSDVLAEHFELLRELYGDEHACRKVRPVIMWYTKGFVGAARLRERGNQVKTPADVAELIRDCRSAQTDPNAPALFPVKEEA